MSPDTQRAYKLRVVEDADASTTPADDAALDLDAVFRRYAPYVAKIGYRLLGRDHEVDDLVQDVFLAAYKGLGSLRTPEAITGWLATVTVRLARRRLKSRRLRVILHLDEVTDYLQLADGAASPEKRAQVAQLYRVLDRVPVDHRLAWSLRFVEGETLERVAELCGCSLATAKRRIKAAREAIDEAVAHGGGAHEG